jgi:type IV secretory pathway component VirB8
MDPTMPPKTTANRPSALQKLKSLLGPAVGSESGNDVRSEKRGLQKPDFPSAFDTGHSHRRLVWAARLLGVVAMAEAFAIMALAFALFSLVPLKRVEVALLQVSPSSEQVVEVKPLRADLPVIEVMTRGWVREYVMTRNSIVPDNDAMVPRLRWINERSSRPVWNEFMERQRAFLVQAISQRLTRTVRVRAVTRDTRRASLWFVDFDTTDSLPDGSVGTRSFRAQILVEFEPRITRAGDLDIREIDNPFGFKVQRYDVGVLGSEIQPGN